MKAVGIISIILLAVFVIVIFMTFALHVVVFKLAASLLVMQLQWAQIETKLLVAC